MVSLLETKCTTCSPKPTHALQRASTSIQLEYSGFSLEKPALQQDAPWGYERAQGCCSRQHRQLARQLPGDRCTVLPATP